MSTYSTNWTLKPLTEVLPGPGEAADDESLAACFLLLQPEHEHAR